MSAPTTLAQYIEQMRPIPEGAFLMGSASSEDEPPLQLGLVTFLGAREDEKPAHLVTLDSYRIGATPITVAMWREYCAATHTPMPKEPYWGWADDHPAVNVSWEDVMGEDGNGGYCAWAASASGTAISLPTEAQWERACRGGRDRMRHPWGEMYDDSRLWCSVETRRVGTAPVCRNHNIFVNDFGVSDLIGNVYEWCWEIYAPYPDSTWTNPRNLMSSGLRCDRGGGWGDHNTTYLRCASRDRRSSEYRTTDIGFRLVAPGP